jgi:hypothetical protein
MKKITDRSDSVGENLPEGHSMLRKMPMINPGFREDRHDSVLKPRILGIPVPQNTRDRKNLRAVITAVLVLGFIVVVLEYKQLRDAAMETGFPSFGLFQGK